MKRIYYSKNMAHSNKNYFVTFTAIPEKEDFHKCITDKRTIRQMENLLQQGRMSQWFRGVVTVTLIGSDICSEIEIPKCSLNRFEDLIKDKRKFNKLIETATLELDRKLSKENFFAYELLSA